jgi:hypothetical protein
MLVLTLVGLDGIEGGLLVRGAVLVVVLLDLADRLGLVLLGRRSRVGGRVLAGAVPFSLVMGLVHVAHSDSSSRPPPCGLGWS